MLGLRAVMPLAPLPCSHCGVTSSMAQLMEEPGAYKKLSQGQPCPQPGQRMGTAPTSYNHTQYSLLVLWVLLIYLLQHVDLQPRSLLVLLHVLYDFECNTRTTPGERQEQDCEPEARVAPRDMGTTTSTLSGATW